MYKSFKNHTETASKVLENQRLPARLDMRDAATLLGFHEHDINVLVNAELLKPLGNPVKNATKYFARCIIEAYADDPKWLWKATQAVYDGWKTKNQKRAQLKAETNRLSFHPKSESEQETSVCLAE